MKYNNKILLLLLAITSAHAHAMNVVSPFDPLIRSYYDNTYRFQLSMLGEGGINTKAYNEDGCEVNPLRIWSEDQNALTMLNGPFCNESIYDLRDKIDANDDGTRGHFLVCGDFDMRGAFAVSGRVFFKNDWSLSLHVPFYAMRLKNVLWVDQTEAINDEDARVRECLTDNIFANVAQFGSGLQLGGWERSGLGDVTVLLEWFKDFAQSRPFLTNARLHWRLGVALPTGKAWDEDKIMALPFGHDRAFALPFGLGLDLTFARYMRGGFDVQLTHIFGNTRNRRIKTDVNQTELLLLQRAQAHKDFGLLQRFELYLEFFRIAKGLCFKFGYQFNKKGEDELSISDQRFSNTVANTAQRLDEYTMHTMVANLWYDFDAHGTDWRVRPEMGLFVRAPFNGKRSIASTTIGGRFSLSF